MADRPLKALVYTDQNSAFHRKWGEAAASGFRAHGIEVSFAPRRGAREDADIICMWGVRYTDKIRGARAAGSKVVILECGYYGDRLENVSVSLGGELNGRATFAKPRGHIARFQATGGTLAPWKHGGEYALICGQVPGDMSLGGRDMAPVYQAAVNTLSERGELVVYRPHPKGAFPSPKGAATQAGTLAEALAGAKYVVAFNSNALTDAVLAGVPAIALDRGAMAWPVAGHGLGEIVRPDRFDWAERLAWSQFTEDEIASGFAWEALNG